MAHEKVNIRKAMDEIAQSERKLSETRKRHQCFCPHTKKGNLELVRTNDPNGLHICKMCQKKIGFRKIEEDELMKAIDVVDRVIDYIKITLDTEDDKDAALLEKLGKAQYRVCHMLPTYYRNARKSSSKRKKNRYSSEGGQSNWGKASIV